MKILQVVPVFSDPFGGPVTVVRSISKELAKKHEVVVYTTTALDPKHDSDPLEEEVNGYKVIYFKRTLKPLCYSGIFGQLNLSYDMMQAVKQHLREFDVVHVHSWQQFPDVLVHHFATKYGIPYVLQVHGSLPRIMVKQRLKWIYDVFLGYKLLKDASKVIALSRIEAVQYKCAGVPAEKIAIVPNGIDLTEYSDLPAKGSFKKKFGLDKNEKIVLYLGRIHRTKGIDLLVKAYAYLTKKMGCKDAVLVIAGPDDGYLNEAKSIARSLGVSNSILFTGFISSEDKLRALVDAEVFVTPSFYGFPVTFLEACAVGVPIIATNFGDSLEWIDENVGYEVPPTKSDLAMAIYRIISDDKLHDDYSKNCRKIVQSEFSVDHVVDKLDQVYAEVTKNSRTRNINHLK
jgi:glycosyltransferase involved in cell wall biosynthesis